MKFLTIKNILFAGIVVFAGILRQEYLGYDDGQHIYNNIHPITISGVKDIFNQIIEGTYLPLTVLSWSLESSLIDDIHPAFSKGINLALHLLNVFFVFKLGCGLNINKSASLLAALIFCVHPIHVESIAWATERKDTLFTAFYLASILAYLKFLNENIGKWYCFSLLFAAGSILSKSMALSLPWILLLIEWRIGKKITILNKLPFAMILWPIAGITWLGSRQAQNFSWPEGFLIWPWCAVTYLTKFFFPVNIHPLYAYPDNKYIYIINIFIFIFVVISLITVKSKTYRFGVWFYILSIFFLWRGQYFTYDIVADRFMYLPGIGFCFLAGHLLSRHCRPGLIMSLCFILALKTMTLLPIWKNSDNFNKMVLAYNPRVTKMWKSLGDTAYNTEKLDIAAAYYSHGLEYADQDDRDELWFKRGRVFAEKKLFDYAEWDFRHIKLWASSQDYLEWHGYVSLNRGEYQRAIHLLSMALKIDPRHAVNRKNLELCREKLKKQELKIIKNFFSLKK